MKTTFLIASVMIGVSTAVSMASDAESRLKSKGFSQGWIRSLTAKGSIRKYSDKELAFIGMPVGGQYAGQVYLSGDGCLWYWDVFNERVINPGVSGDKYYNSPLVAKEHQGVKQGFWVEVDGQRRALNKEGFSKVTFKETYPVGHVELKDPASPVDIKLAAYSPFAPLNDRDSSIPAVVMSYTVKNAGSANVVVRFGGWLENATHRKGVAKGSVTPKQSSILGGQGVLFSGEVASGHKDLLDAPDAGTFALVLLNPKADLLKRGDAETGRMGMLQTQSFTLKAKESRIVRFAIAWHMPNIHRGEKNLRRLKELDQQRHGYTEFYSDAEAVAADLLNRHESLEKMTFDWVRTWYDSTLPRWFLSRTFFNVSTLATTVAHRFYHPSNPSLNHRPYFWEGVYLGDGTCSHVTHYEQAFGRLFPQAGRDQRRAADFDAGWDDQLGYSKYRAEFGFGAHFGIPHAADGMAGTILRSYREHTTNKNDTFLKAQWPKIKRAMNFMIDQDAGRGYFEKLVPEIDKNSQPDGLLTGPQYNTLDRCWFGKIPWISGLYQAALIASAEMSEEMGDAAFAKSCRKIAALGKKNLTSQLFNQDFGYYVQKGYEGKKAININDGSHIDQLLGQYWAAQVGLDRVFPEKESRLALGKLFEHNFYKKTEDYRKTAFIKPARFYADDDEAGMFMCTFPHGGAKKSVNESGVIGGYFSECMDGFTYAAASTMISEGMVLEGLALCRSIDDRYAGGAERRNPFNEVEYGNHYTRSMASYAAYVSMCGFTYHGPRKEIGFAPQMQAENFKAAFTAAEGWGSFSQKRTGGQQLEILTVQSGKITLKTLHFTGRADSVGTVKLSMAGRKIPAKLTQQGEKLSVTLDHEVTLKAGDALLVKFLDRE